MNESVKPAPGLVLVAPSGVDDSEKQLPSGLLLAGLTRDEEERACALTRGIVLTCGPQTEEFWSDLETGSAVLYHAHTAFPVGENDLVPVTEIAAIVEDHEDRSLVQDERTSNFS